MANLKKSADEAILSEITRLELVNTQTPVHDVLKYDGRQSFTLKVAHRNYIKIAQQIDPENSEVFDKMRATKALGTISRAFAQCKHASQVDSWKRNRFDTSLATTNFGFIVPAELLYSEQQSLEEVELIEARIDAKEVAATEYSKVASLDAEVSETSEIGASRHIFIAPPVQVGGDSDEDDASDCDDADIVDRPSGANSLPGNGAPDAYPEFQGEEHSYEHHKYLRKRKSEIRRQRQRCTSKRAKHEAKELLKVDREDSKSWKPPSLNQVTDPAVDTLYEARWMCERNGRSWGAKLGLKRGVTLEQNHESVKVRCGNKECTAMVKYALQPRTKLWRCISYDSAHHESCFGPLTSAQGSCKIADSKCATSAYLSRHVAQLILPHLATCPKLGRKFVARKVSDADVFTSFPSRQFLGEVAKVTKKLAAEAENLKLAVPPDADAVVNSSSIAKI